MKKLILNLAILSTTGCCFAAPHEIIIIRHADKWVQANPGPFLSPKGQVRAEKFVSYYLSHFKKPDFIFAANPVVSASDTSYRPLQTIMPLANQLAFQNPNAYPVNTTFHNTQYPMLAKALLNDSKYQNKIILICWHHGRADALANQLGVTQKLAKWEGNNFDQVYILKYNLAGKLNSFRILKNQYPVNSNPTWSELASH